MKKIKIIFGYDNWIIGGVERTLVNLMTELSAKYEVMLLVTKLDKERQYYEIPSSIKLIEVEAENLCDNMLREIIQCKADLFVGSGNMNCEFLQIYEQLHGKIATIMVNHNFWHYPYMHEAFLSEIAEIRNENIKYPDAIIGLTQIASYLCQKATGRKVYTIGNMNSFESQKTISWNDKENIVLAIARFNDPVKRLDIILKLFSNIYERYQDCKLVVVGAMNYEEIYGEKITDTLKNLKLPISSVCFEGEQSNVEKYYNKAKVFLFASDLEGFGLVLNEAANYGIPVIAKYYLGIEDIITHGKNGYYFDETNGEEFSEVTQACVKLLKNKEKWNEMSKYSQEMAERFSKKNILAKWENIINQTLNIYNEDARKEENYVPSIREFENCIISEEEMIKKMIVRINRSDNAQRYLREMYENEKKKRGKLKRKVLNLLKSHK